MTSEHIIRLSETLDLSQKQRACFALLKDDQTREVLYGGGAGGGKSFLGCVWLIRNSLRYAGTRWLMGRSELKTLKQTTLVTFFQVAALFGLSAGTDYNYNQQKGEISFSNNSVIILADLKLYPTDPNFDSLGSLEITGAFVDECNQLVEKAWDVVRSRIRFKLDENGLIPKMLGSCNPAKNWVYARFYKPSKDKKLPPERAFVQALVGDNPKISRHYLTNLDGLPKVLRMRLRDGIWEYDDDPSALIEFEKIVDIWSNSHVAEGAKYIVADVARFGRDSTKISVWSGFRLLHWYINAKTAITDVADEIIRLMEKYAVPASNVIIDEDGVGGGVVDILKAGHYNVKGFINNATPLPNPKAPQKDPKTGKPVPDNYANLKSQCYFMLADLVNSGGLYIDCDMETEEREKLTEELEQVKQKNMDKDTKREVISKDDVKALIGRSPDGSDNLMMRMYFELKPKAPSWGVI